MPHKRKGKMFWDYFTCPKCGAKAEGENEAHK